MMGGDWSSDGSVEAGLDGEVVGVVDGGVVGGVVVGRVVVGRVVGG